MPTNTNDASEILIAGTGQLYVAPWSTSLTLPEEPGTVPGNGLSTAFVDVGYTTEDGVSLSLDRDSQSVMAWQSTRSVRRFNASQVESFTATLLQWNETNLALAFGGGEVTLTSADNYRYDFPEAGEVDERAVILDWVDDTRNYRLVIPRTIVIDSTEVALARTAPSTLPITFEAVAEAPYILTDDDAFSGIS